MFDSQLYRKLSLTAALLGFFTAAACSDQPATVASRRSAQATGSAASSAATVSPAGDPAAATQPLRLVTLPKGTKITATVDQTLASNRNHWGDAFVATLARPVKVDGKTVLPRGTEVTGRIREVKSHELKVVLSSVVVDGIYCDLNTNSRRPSDKDQPKNTTRKRNKDNSTLSARTRLTFKLSKPATVPVKPNASAKASQRKQCKEEKFLQRDSPWRNFSAASILYRVPANHLVIPTITQASQSK